jgi:lysophosphatidate acyltransferase
MFLSILKPLAVVSTIALSTLGVLSRKYRRARYAFHLTLYAGTLGFMSVAGVFISLVATIAGQVSVRSLSVIAIAGQACLEGRAS